MTQLTSGRVLITGIGGFTGYHLQALLAEHGYEVHGTAQMHEPESEFVHRANLLDTPALAAVLRKVRPQYVLHLAAVSFVAHDDVGQVYATNVVGTRNLLSCLADMARSSDSPLRAIMLASSANIYGNAAQEPICEDAPWQPMNDYAISKCAMEQVASLWSPRLPITIVRPFNYTGVGQPKHFLIPKIVDAFRQRAPALELGNIDVERDFSDVRDVAEMYRRIMERSPGGVFNVCSGRAMSLREVLRLTEELTGHSLAIRVNPALVRANEVTRLLGSSEKLETLIGTWPRRSMRETLQWMLQAA